MAEVTLSGRGEMISIYSLKNDFEIDSDSYDINSLADQEALYKRVEELVDSGEIDAIMPSLQKRILFRDDALLTIEDEEYSLDDVELKDENIEDFLELFESYEDNEIFFVRRIVGDGEFVFESEEDEISIDDVSLNYIDCADYLDIVDVVQEDIVETVCDSIDIDSIDVKEQTLQESEGYFDPTVTIDELYIAKYNPEEDIFFLERLEVGGEKLVSADLYVDDFDKN